jgi:ribosome-associated protein
LFRTPWRRTSPGRDCIAGWKEQEINSLELAQEAARALEDKLARDIRVLDVRGISDLTDYQVVASGTSSPHLKALVTEVVHRLKQRGAPVRRSGLPESGWVVVDGLDAVIHIFAPEARAYYGIESLWAGAKAVPPSPPPAPA